MAGLDGDDPSGGAGRVFMKRIARLQPDEPEPEPTPPEPVPDRERPDPLELRRRRAR